MAYILTPYKLANYNTALAPPISIPTSVANTSSDKFMNPANVNSFKLSKGCTITMYANANFSGNTITYSAGENADTQVDNILFTKFGVDTNALRRYTYYTYSPGSQPYDTIKSETLPGGFTMNVFYYIESNYQYQRDGKNVGKYATNWVSSGYSLLPGSFNLTKQCTLKQFATDADCATELSQYCSNSSNPALNTSTCQIYCAANPAACTTGFISFCGNGDNLTQNPNCKAWALQNASNETIAAMAREYCTRHQKEDEEFCYCLNFPQVDGLAKLNSFYKFNWSVFCNFLKCSTGLPGTFRPGECKTSQQICIPTISLEAKSLTVGGNVTASCTQSQTQNDSSNSGTASPPANNDAINAAINTVLEKYQSYIIGGVVVFFGLILLTCLAVVYRSKKR